MRVCLTQTNRIIVKFHPIPANSDTTIQQLVEDICRSLPQGGLVRGPNSSGRAVFFADPAADAVRLAAELSERDYVAYAEPDVVDHEA